VSHHFSRNLGRTSKSLPRSEKLVTRGAFGGPRSPCVRHGLATTLARDGSHNGFTPGSVALHFVSARDKAADYDKTSGPPGYAGLLALPALVIGIVNFCNLLKIH